MLPQSRRERNNSKVERTLLSLSKITGVKIRSVETGKDFWKSRSAYSDVTTLYTGSIEILDYSAASIYAIAPRLTLSPTAKKLAPIIAFSIVVA